ncbi:MAG TPA: class I lanthipeptide [Candidatus Kapabacteria bacterium]|nr:class I lanthipeptide [Candidatus Kapabacteria bacterium]
MKTKRFNKKLVLNKKTIADLSNFEMGKIQGGLITTSRLGTCFETICTRCETNCPAGAYC